MKNEQGEKVKGNYKKKWISNHMQNYIYHSGCVFFITYMR